MGGGNGGEGGRPVPIAQGGEEIPGIQPALGVGDEMELFTSCLGKDLLHPPGQSLSVLLHGGPAVLTAEIDLRPVAAEGVGDTAPVAQVLPVPEACAVDE